MPSCRKARLAGKSNRGNINNTDGSGGVELSKLDQNWRVRRACKANRRKDTKLPQVENVGKINQSH